MGSRGLAAGFFAVWEGVQPDHSLVVTAFLLLLSLVCPLFSKSWFCAIASPSHGFVTVKGLSVQRLIGQPDKNVHNAIRYGVNEQQQGGNSRRIQDDCIWRSIGWQKINFPLHSA